MGQNLREPFLKVASEFLLDPSIAVLIGFIDLILQLDHADRAEVGHLRQDLSAGTGGYNVG